MTALTSRVGRKPISVPSGVDVKLLGQHELTIKGPKGSVNVALHPLVKLDIEGSLVTINFNPETTYIRSGSGSKLRRSIAGTTRAQLNNLINGVSKGFERKLVLVGVGYRAQAKGNVLTINIGYSHPVVYTVPTGVTIETPSQTEIIIKGSDKHLVGHVASTIRSVRPPEPYKGKGIRYSDEKVVRKETKKK